MRSPNTGAYVDRDVVFISLSDTETDFLHAEKVVLRSKANRSLDLGQFCFLNRALKATSSGKKPHAPRIIQVDPASLCKERLLVVSKLIEAFRASTNTDATLMRRYNAIRAFFIYIDSHDTNISNEAQDSEYYLRWLDSYVSHLRKRTKLMPTNPNHLLQGGAYANQLSVIWLMDVVFGFSAEDVQARVNLFVRKNTNQPRRSVKREDFKTTTQAHLLVFQQLSEFLMARRKFPLRIDLSQVGYGESDFYSSRQPKIAAWKFDKNLNPVSVDTMIPHYAAIGQSTTWGQLNVVYKSVQKQIERPLSSLSENQNLRTLVCYATSAFLHAFVAETGANGSVIPKLRKGDESDQPVTRGLKFSGLKARAGNRVVTPEFGAAFLPWFRRYEKFRAWVLKSLEIKDHEYWFFTISTPPNSGKILIRSTSMGFEVLKRQYKNFLKAHFPDLVWIDWQNLRLATSDNFLKASESDIGLTAIKLSNKVETVRDKYSHSSIEDAASEISAMFEALSKSIIRKSRTTTSPIKVTVLGPADPAIETMSGECTASSNDNPTRSPEFTDAVLDPHCTKAESCLFCKYFAVHADEKDVRKLLSIIFLIPLFLSASATDTAFIETLAPLMHRANEVLKQIEEVSDESKKLVARVKESVDEGNLEPFWEDHFDYLIEMNYL